MILSDVSIKFWCEKGLITPWYPEQIQPASYDLMLGELPEQLGFMYLQPGQFILASTLEKVHLPDWLVGRIEGKSTWARRGLIIHTAGFVDPGFKGQLTLEMTNLSQEIISLKLGDRIAQIAFQRLDTPAARPYGSNGLGSHYQNQEGITQASV